MKDIVEVIREKLEEIETQKKVKVLFAVESGSRAWGVASSDSDYDVRFIYVRKWEDYLRLEESKDVIEWQIDNVLDINGWDLKKALQHFHKGNATVFEWCNSPIVYITTPEWKKISKTGAGYFSEKAAIYHYYGTARSTYEGYLTGDTVSYKKYIYALRPLLACRYIEDHHSVPPVLFEELKELELPESIKEDVDKMLIRKAGSMEKEGLPQIPGIINFIRSELGRLSMAAKAKTDDHWKDWEPLNSVFLETILIGETLSYVVH